MFESESFLNKVLTIDPDEFDTLSLSLFKYQSKYNRIYRNFIDFCGIKVRNIQSPGQIPFLPIRFFRDQVVKTGDWEPVRIFESSGTTGQVPARHYVRDVDVYHRVIEAGISNLVRPDQPHSIMGLLPSYLERGNSSLVEMVRYLIARSGSERSGFYLYDHESLLEGIARSRDAGEQVFLIGVTFALLDLAEKHPVDLSDVVIMETGGMKGRREELTRRQVHAALRKSFGVKQVWSEYGMTELMSQAYSERDGIYRSPPWMKVYLRDITDPFDRVEPGHNGAVNIIDLANIHTCAFIETSDLGRLNSDNSFEILGRMDNAELRGCNIMVS